VKLPIFRLRLRCGDCSLASLNGQANCIGRKRWSDRLEKSHLDLLSAAQAF
jgi:hypothetical protein